MDERTSQQLAALGRVGEAPEEVEMPREDPDDAAKDRADFLRLSRLETARSDSSS